MPPARSPGGTSAFTILELMIVVATIGLLSILVLPGVVRARNTSLVTKCLVNQRQILDGAMRYEIEYNRSMMGISKNGAAIRNLLISQEYISHPMTFDCPISPIKDYDDYWLNYNGYDLRSTTCTINGAHLLQ